jgi:gas vesicle protein
MELKMSENNNKIKIMISFLIGGAIGSAIALLYAPKEGRQLRTDISLKTKEIIEEGKNTTEQVWTDTKEKVGNIMDGANELLGKAKILIVDESNRVKSAVKTGYKKLTEPTSIPSEESSMTENDENSDS